MKICIIGGVAGGASAATRLRRLDEKAEIILFERGEHISYANCGLPYYISGTIKQKENLIVAKPELLVHRFAIDVRTRQEVQSIDTINKELVIEDLNSGNTYRESYDKIVLSPGAAPKIFFPDAMKIPGVFSLRNINDTYAIDNYLKEHTVKTALVVGGGFIGIEMAENLKERGIHTSIVEFSDHVAASFDHEIANILHHKLQEKGVALYLKTAVKEIHAKDKSIAVSLSTGELLNADLLLLSTGVAPESTLAKDAGLSLGPRNTIDTNAFMQTSDPNIYAVGDAVCVEHAVTGEKTSIPLAGPANRQGRFVAGNLLSKNADCFDEVSPVAVNRTLGSSVLKVFDLTAASTGLTETQCIASKIPYKKTYIHPFSHAGYYPGATQISMKLLFSPEGLILGAQAIGYEGVEKRIDVIASSMYFKGSIYDLSKLELCYAPPYSSAKDPVNMAGYTASNILQGLMPVVYAENILNQDLTNTLLIDVSTKEEVLMGTIEGSINLPLDTLRTQLSKLDRSKKIIVFCRVGLRGYIATRILLQNGFNAYNLSGGYKTFKLVEETETYYVPKEKELKPKEQSEFKHSSSKQLTLDACGLSCPGPIQKVSAAIAKMSENDTISIQATDPGFASDISVWCERTGNTLLSSESQNGFFHVTVQKGTKDPVAFESKNAIEAGSFHDKTMVIFSGDLDKAIAAFIIANGALSMQRNVTLFFTFWGLNILRKDRYAPVKKDLISKLFGHMMPRGSKKLKLSRMNFAGAGGIMIRSLMKKKNVASLEELISSAIENGVRIVACQMSMDLMGIQKEELIDGVEIGGVATFLGSAETSDTNLFI